MSSTSLLLCCRAMSNGLHADGTSISSPTVRIFDEHDDDDNDDDSRGRNGRRTRARTTKNKKRTGNVDDDGKQNRYK